MKGCSVNISVTWLIICSIIITMRYLEKAIRECLHQFIFGSFCSFGVFCGFFFIRVGGGWWCKRTQNYILYGHKSFLKQTLEKFFYLYLNQINVSSDDVVSKPMALLEPIMLVFVINRLKHGQWRSELAIDGIVNNKNQSNI